MSKKGVQRRLPHPRSNEESGSTDEFSIEAMAKLNPDALGKLRELLRPAVPTEVFVTYWAFAVARQRVFFRRFNGFSPPWTTDETLASHRFTNAYRVTDRVSQYLIKHVQYDQKWCQSDLFFRTILFKFFNRISTWRRLAAECGEPQWSRSSLEQYGQVLDTAMAQGERIYSAAYIMPSGGPNSGFQRKHRMHLNLLERMMKEGVPAKIAKARSMADAFALLRSFPTIGGFLAYQYVTDLNYSELIDFEENSFAVAGPGACEGIEKCFRDRGGKDLVWIIQRVREVQDEAFVALGTPFQALWGRKLKAIDCQNLFCEVAKFARVHHPAFNGSSGRTRIKQKFVANTEPIEYAFPPKWGVTVPKPTPLKHVATV